jgi:hypothetical protein
MEDDWKETDAALKEVVKSFGGDPKDRRQRLDALLDGRPKYWQDR